METPPTFDEIVVYGEWREVVLCDMSYYGNNGYLDISIFLQ